MFDGSVIWDVPIINIKDYVKRNPDKDIDKLNCIWPLDGHHDKVVAVASMFDGKLEIPICDYHLGWHRGILTLYYCAKIDVETLLTNDAPSVTPTFKATLSPKIYESITENIRISAAK